MDRHCRRFTHVFERVTKKGFERPDRPSVTELPEDLRCSYADRTVPVPQERDEGVNRRTVLYYSQGKHRGCPDRGVGVSESADEPRNSGGVPEPAERPCRFDPDGGVRVAERISKGNDRRGIPGLPERFSGPLPRPDRGRMKISDIPGR